MSYRVTQKIEMDDIEVAKQALKMIDCDFIQNGQTLRVTSGRLQGAVLDLKRQVLEGDTDFANHNQNSFGLFRQTYAEAKVRNVAAKTGVTIEQRVVQDDGSVVLYCYQS